jgi:hypothetical protein
VGVHVLTASRSWRREDHFDRRPCGTLLVEQTTTSSAEFMDKISAGAGASGIPSNCSGSRPSRCSAPTIHPPTSLHACKCLRPRDSSVRTKLSEPFQPSVPAVGPIRPSPSGGEHPPKSPPAPGKSVSEIGARRINLTLVP